MRISDHLAQQISRSSKLALKLVEKNGQRKIVLVRQSHLPRKHGSSPDILKGRLKPAEVGNRFSRSVSVSRNFARIPASDKSVEVPSIGRSRRSWSISERSKNVPANSQTERHVSRKNALMEAGKPVYWRSVHSLFESFRRKGDLSSAAALAQKIKLTKQIPTTRMLDCLVKIFVQQPSYQTGVVLLNILNTSVKYTRQVSPQALDSLIWTIRKHTDPTLRAAFQNTLESYCATFAIQNTSILQALISSYCQAGNAEQAISSLLVVYPDILETDALEATSRPAVIIESRQVPFDKLIVACANTWDGLDEATKLYCFAVSKNITILPSTEMLLLDVCLQHVRASPAPRLLCHTVQLIYENLKRSRISLPEQQLSSLATFAGYNSWPDILLEVSAQISSRSGSVMPVELCAAVIEAAAILDMSEEHNLRPILEACDRMITLCPNLSPRDVPLFAEALSNRKARELCEEYLRSRRPFDHHTSFVPDTVLYGLRVHSLPTIVFRAYQSIKEVFRPNLDTLHTLLTCAYRLGDAKKVSYVIYNKLVCEGDVIPDRRAFEIAIATQMCGKSFSGLFFFLNEMSKYSVKVSNHLHHKLISKFEKLNDGRYLRWHGLSSSMRGSSVISCEFPSDNDLLKHSTSQNKHFMRYNCRKDLYNTKKFFGVSGVVV